MGTFLRHSVVSFMDFSRLNTRGLWDGRPPVASRVLLKKLYGTMHIVKCCRPMVGEGD